MIRRRNIVAVAVLAVLFGTGPTVGDVGGCGRKATPLDEGAFARQRKALDCQRCQECGLTTSTCQRACDPAASNDVDFPPTCYPLAHDGEVCLHALQAASCDSYAHYVDDMAPTQPSECAFCRLVPGAGGGGGE